MTSQLRSRIALAMGPVFVAAGMLLAPLPAAASHGIKCGLMQTGPYTWTYVCGVKGP